MEKLFADFETSKMLKALGFNEKCFGFYYCEKMQFEMFDFVETTHDWEPNFIHNSDKRDDYVSAPVWQQIEEWLWEKHKISIEIERVSIHAVLYKVRIYQYIDNEPGLINYLHFESPITCKLSGIKTAVTFLSDAAVAVTPINTSANGA